MRKDEIIKNLQLEKVNLLIACRSYHRCISDTVDGLEKQFTNGEFKISIDLLRERKNSIYSEIKEIANG